MKTIKQNPLLNKVLQLSLVLAISIFAFSCNDDDEVNLNEESAVASDEAEIDATYEDIDDVVALSLEVTDVNAGGRLMEKPDDGRFDCATVTFEGDKNAGSITIDFGDGCEGPRGHVRAGIIRISYTGRRFEPGHTAITTFENFSINDIKVEGIRTVTNVAESTEDAPKFNIVLEDGKLTWPDETFATREVNRTREWIRAANPLNDEMHVDCTASGVTRRGNAYSVVTTDLVFKRLCRLPVSGTKVITTENKVITIDFGDGECDKKVTITVEGRSEEITVG